MRPFLGTGRPPRATDCPGLLFLGRRVLGSRGRLTKAAFTIHSYFFSNLFLLFLPFFLFLSYLCVHFPNP